MSASRASLGIWLRSLVYFFLYNLFGVVHSLVSLLLAPMMGFEQRHRFVNLWTRASMWLLRSLNGVEIEVLGLERIPRDQAVVVMSNHQSQWETFYLQLLVSPQATVLKRELLWVPFFGWALALLKPIAIDRSKPINAMKSLLRQGKERLDAGVSVVIFPEGTRQPPGRVGKFNAGGAKLACHAGRLVVPIAHNAGACWPARSILRLPGRIRVVVGPPIRCDAGPEQVLARAEQWIRSTVNELEAATDAFPDPDPARPSVVR